MSDDLIRAAAARLAAAGDSRPRAARDPVNLPMIRNWTEVIDPGGPADPDTAELMTWLDVQLKRNIVLTFGGGVNEIQRELIATAGLGLPRAPR